MMQSIPYPRLVGASLDYNASRYNGRMTDPPEEFLPEMEQACEIVEKVVNEELKKRNRYPLEYAGTQGKDLRYTKPVWEANVAAANCYEGAKESVGFHSDQLTYLGPYPTIASLSLGTMLHQSLF